MFIDTHTHLFTDVFDADRRDMLKRAAVLCSALVLPNIDEESIPKMLEMADTWPDLCFPTMGLHPSSVFEDYPDVLKRMEGMLETRTWYGIGETGLDLYWDKSTLPQQQEALRVQCQWAKSLGVPIILHSREATDETLEIIQQEQDGRLKGVFHCFSGTEAQAKAIFDQGFCIGIGGVVTYPKTHLRELLRTLGPERVVLETDSPYLPPVPYRGKRNESAYIALVAEACALAWGMQIKDVGRITSKTARKLFNLPEPQLT
jgi:TatD DNase family protein